MGIIAGLCCFVAGGTLWWVDADVAVNDTVTQSMVHVSWIALFAVGIIFIGYSAIHSGRFR